MMNGEPRNDSGWLRAVGVLAGIAVLTLPLAALSAVPWSVPHSDAAVLRLSWRTNVRGEEQCRDRTPAELEALPVHMRAPRVCQADRANYVIVSAVDGAPDDTVHLIRGGVKGDRPLFVLEERRLAPGRHRLQVKLLRVDGDTAKPLLAPLDTVVQFRAGRVTLVTTAPEESSLTVR